MHLDNFGYAAVALFIMIESSGIPFPGETMLLLASFYAAVKSSVANTTGYCLRCFWGNHR